MKFLKTMLAAVALVAATPAAWAEGKIAIGPQGGLTFPNYDVSGASPASQYGNKDGWLAGLFVEFGVWTITLRPEVNYVVRKYTVTSVAEVKGHYLEVPVLLKLNPLSDFVVSPFIVVGPQWAKRIRSEVSTAGTTTFYRDTADDWDLSGVAGLGIEFNISENIGLNVQGRYIHGFRDIDTSATEIRTRAFYALAGLSIQDAF